MTTRDEARRATADTRADGYRLDGARADARTEDRHGRESDRAGSVRQAPLPERLYAARERKGVDLYRAERDTKIRARYLAALERGEYRELPGDVYTKGFLRNYALYLGLDPEEVVAQWRRERGGEGAVQKTVLTVPKPMAQPRRGLQFSPGIIVAALLTMLIVGVGVWLGVQVQRFAKPPTLTMTSPREATLQLDETATTYTFEGKSIAGATITIEMAGGSRQVSADSTGVWSATVDLRRGRNTFTIDATDPDTGKHAETPAQIVITVPISQAQGPTLDIDNPAEGTVFENGAVPVQGRATNATSVTVTATYDGPATGQPAPAATPAPSVAAPSPGASGAPAAGGTGGGTGPSLTIPVTSDGTWDTGTNPLQLTTGRWTITVKASNETASATLTRHVSVAYKGVNLTVTIKGGAAWIKVWVDGQIAPSVGRAGKTYRDGQTVSFTGTTSIEVRTGSSGATLFTLNGQSLGALGKRGIPETWLFQPPAPPQKTQRN